MWTRTQLDDNDNIAPSAGCGCQLFNFVTYKAINMCVVVLLM